MISAKAGGINAITGQADVHPKGESDWQQLSITDDLDSGDRVRTANDGRIEILLNPGSYLRVGGDSEVELSEQHPCESGSSPVARYRDRGSYRRGWT